MSFLLSLVLVSLSGGFGLLLSSHGRLFIKFLLSQITDDAVAGALSFETAQCAFHVFVFSDFNRRHSSQPSFASGTFWYALDF